MEPAHYARGFLIDARAGFDVSGWLIVRLRRQSAYRMCDCVARGRIVIDGGILKHEQSY